MCLGFSMITRESSTSVQRTSKTLSSASPENLQTMINLPVPDPVEYLRQQGMLRLKERPQRRKRGFLGVVEIKT
jgi:hypothetical protein